MENAKKFFEETLKTEEAKALLASLEKPETEEDVIEAYLGVAEKLGVELSAEDIQAYFAAGEYQGELDDEELEQLVGGASGNCWLNEYCDKFFKDLSDQCGIQMKNYSNGSESSPYGTTM